MRNWSAAEVTRQDLIKALQTFRSSCTDGMKAYRDQAGTRRARGKFAAVVKAQTCPECWPNGCLGSWGVGVEFLLRNFAKNASKVSTWLEANLCRWRLGQ